MTRSLRWFRFCTATAVATGAVTFAGAFPQQKVTSERALGVGATAPSFALLDAYTGKKRTLSELRKPTLEEKRLPRSVALFFFCGCLACRAVATEWAKYQQAGVLPEKAATVIVYSTSDRLEARERVATSGLDPKRTAILCDTESLSVTESLYHAEPCPRIVVINLAGKIVYTNLGNGENPQETPPARLTTSALAALEAIEISTMSSAPR